MPVLAAPPSPPADTAIRASGHQRAGHDEQCTYAPFFDGETDEISEACKSSIPQ